MEHACIHGRCLGPRPSEHGPGTSGQTVVCCSPSVLRTKSRASHIRQISALSFSTDSMEEPGKGPTCYLVGLLLRQLSHRREKKPPERGTSSCSGHMEIFLPRCPERESGGWNQPGLPRMRKTLESRREGTGRRVQAGVGDRLTAASLDFPGLVSEIWCPGDPLRPRHSGRVGPFGVQTECTSPRDPKPS